MQLLTDSELKVMTVIWDSKNELHLPEIVQMVNEKYEKTWSPQTVSTFLTRMRTKQYIDMYKQGRVYYYKILISREDFIVEYSKEIEFLLGSKYTCKITKKK